MILMVIAAITPGRSAAPLNRAAPGGMANLKSCSDIFEPTRAWYGCILSNNSPAKGMQVSLGPG